MIFSKKNLRNLSAITCIEFRFFKSSGKVKLTDDTRMDAIGRALKSFGQYGLMQTVHDRRK